MTDDARPDRNLAMELVRVTESAALAAGRWIGHGDKLAADGAAVDAMRLMIDSVSMHGTVVIGEGEKDEAPMLYNGEQIGDGSPPAVDIAVDPLEGTTLAKGYHFDGFGHVPSYLEWVTDCEMRDTYRYHRRVLRLLQWHCPPRPMMPRGS